MKLQLMAAVIISIPLAAQTVSPAELLLKEAQHKQQVERDLAGAIKIYEQIVSTKSGDRAVIARALLGLAECDEKLGKQSEDVYRRIVHDYNDQPAAAEARTRLAALRPPAPATMTQHRIELPPNVSVANTDGQRAIYRDDAAGGVVIGDLAGKKKVIFKLPAGPSNILAASRDLSMAYLSLRKPDGSPSRVVIKSDGTGSREIPPGEFPSTLSNQNLLTTCSVSWSWDAHQLLECFQAKDGMGYLIVTSVADGKMRMVMRLENKYIGAASFSPDGRFIAYSASEGSSVYASGGSSIANQVFVLPSQGGDPQLISANATLLDWTHDGHYLAVAGPRSGVTALQLLPVKDGHPAGEPLLVRYGSFLAGHTLASGALLYFSAPEGGRFPAWIADLGPDGHPGEWKRLILGSNSGLWPVLKWSSDSGQITWTDSNEDTGQAGFVVRTRNLTTGKERDLYRSKTLAQCGWASRHSNLFCTDHPNANAGTTDVFSITVDSDADPGRVEQLGSVQGDAHILAVAPDDQALYFGMTELKNITLWNIGTGKGNPVAERDYGRDNLNATAPSPDGSWLRRMEKGNLEVRSTSGGEWRALLPLRAGSSLGFSPDGKWIFYHDVDAAGKDGLYRVATTGGAPERLGDFPSNALRGRLAISPNGRKIIAETADTNVRPEVALLENFEPKQPATK